MARGKGLKKQIKSVLIEKSVYDVLAELRDFSGLPIVQLVTQLFEYTGFVKRRIISNFFDELDSTQGKRKFKEWKQLKKTEEEDDDGIDD